MHCLDCHATGTHSATVGICHGCGAGVCAGHTRIAARSVRRGPLPGAFGEAPARRVLCPVCAAAESPAATALTP
ncbi:MULTISPECIES: DUF2180 family protein [unclassified Streptomyces]|uniref:DUF2180 family protein n=1 Tax=unclassified Streptomyces TaxID=2593676 RepID=UPI00093B9753|nr:DUF2180 family protein [Streptomyces sp. TSRI0281]